MLPAHLGPCIYCGQPANGREHWLPASLGSVQGDVTLFDRICTPCNIDLGHTVDQEFARTGLVGYMRAAHAVVPGGGAGPGPFYYRAGAAQPPTQLRIPDPEGRYEVLAEARPHPEQEGQFIAAAIRQIIFRTQDGVIAQLAFPRAWTADILRGAIRQRGLEAAEPVELYLDDDETPDSAELRAVLFVAIPNMPTVKCWYGGSSDAIVTQRGELRAGISITYIRALAKLGFHYFLKYSNLYRGSEQEFAAIRAFIRNGDGNWRQFVQLMANPFVPQLGDARPARPVHFLMTQLDERVAVAGIHLFVTRMMPPASLVRLGPSPRRIVGAPILTAHQVRYLALDQVCDGGHVAELEAIDVTARRIVPVQLRIDQRPGH